MKQAAYATLGALFTAVVASAVHGSESKDAGAAQPAPGCATSGCHLPIRAHQRLHEPVAENQCDACHEPKQGATPFQSGPRHEFKRAGDNPELCYACHDRLARHRLVHEPVNMGVCVLCHDPHGAEHSALLRVDTDRQLCVQCHRVAFGQGGHVHPPVSDGTCGACHDPHGSDHEKFLRAAPPELCLDCHVAVEELLDEASVTHSVVTTGRSCLACHDPHISKFERLLVREQMGLCLSCHDRELDSGEGMIADLARYLKSNPNHHGPVSDGNCTACHNPHGGTVFRMLLEAYPPGPYAPFEEGRYALCFDCHESQMVEHERDDEATEFRNGDLNLHYAHVRRQDRGCTCGTCHDVHAGTGPKHMADPMTSKRQALLIRYEPSATGGSCQSGCHTMRAYDRVRPVENE